LCRIAAPSPVGLSRPNEVSASERRRPDRRVAEAARVARRDDDIAKVEVVTMRLRQAGDRDVARFVRRA
jgi:hypothetical protein